MDEKQKILIVDDRKENLVALRQVLSDVDAEIVEATSGNQALKTTLVHDFSLAILDVQMPEMDGYELAELLRGDPKTANLPVIFMTAAYGEEIDVFKGYEAGAVDYIVKPYNPAVLLAKVHIFLDLQRAQKELARRVLELSASEERYRTLVTTVPDIVYRIDTEGRFTFLNNAVKSIGYNPEELIGRPFAEIVIPADVENVSRRFVLPRFAGNRTGDEGAPKLFDERRTRARQTLMMEVRLVSRRAGRAVPAELHSGGRPVLTAEVNSSGLYGSIEGRPPTFLGSVGIIRDISQRKEAEVELSRYRQGLEKMVEEQTAELKKRVKEVNCLYAISSLFAKPFKSIDEALKSAADLIPTGWQYPEIACARITFEGREFTTANFRETPWKLCADLTIPSSAFPVPNSVLVCYLEEMPALEEGPFLKEERGLIDELARQLAVMIQREWAEEKLRENEERYRSILDSIDQAYFEIDVGGNFTFFNDSLVKILGYPREELAGMNYRRYIAPESSKQIYSLFNGTYRTGTPIKEVKYEIIRKDGSHRWHEMSASLMRDSAGRPIGFRGVAQDITENKNMEEQLIQSQKMETIGRLAGGIAHDFNNLLTAITGNAEMALMDVGKEDPLHEVIEEIKGAGERAAGLTRQLLAFSRKQILQFEILNLNEMMREMEKILRRLIGEDIDLQTVLSPELGLVEADPGQVEQILMNLVINSRDAMPRGGKLTIETKNVDLDEAYAHAHMAVTPGPYVMLAVSDTGIGMDKETQSRIFEPFFTTKEKGKGTGLGLSTVYGIVKQSNGNIWAYSEPGKGTTFKIYLPIVEKTAHVREKTKPETGSLRGSEIVLVVEDDELVRNMALKVLKLYGYTILCARDGHEALRLCRDHKGPIHMMLTDIVMPGMGGRELAERLKGSLPDVKVLYMSGYTDNAIVHHGVLEDGIAFIQKPFTPEGLARKVRETLGIEN